MSHQVQGKPSLLDYLHPFHPQTVDQVVVLVLVNLQIVKSSPRHLNFTQSEEHQNFNQTLMIQDLCGQTRGGSEPFWPF
jgi:hypothetical protein